MINKYVHSNVLKMEQLKLEEFNHWWTDGSVDKELALPFKRDIYDEIKTHVNKRFILALVGLRRVGKQLFYIKLLKV